MLVEFPLKLSFSFMCGTNFQIYGVHIPRKRIDLRHFYSCPSSLKASSCHHALDRRKLLIPSVKNLFPQQQKRVEETMICFIKIQSENIKMNWNIRFFIFCMIWRVGWVNAQIRLTNCYYIEKFGLVGIIYKYTKFGF